MQIPAPLDPVESLKEKFPDDVLHVKQFAGETTVSVAPSALHAVMVYLRGTPGLIYNFLSDISAVDYYPTDYGDEYEFRPERFGVAYHIYSMLYNRRLRIKIYLPEEEPAVDTVVDVWPAANWLEREIKDMMGIEFVGHPDPRRLLMPDDWQGYPHRRDYPMGKETVQFSFNMKEIMKHKPFARD